LTGVKRVTESFRSRETFIITGVTHAMESKQAEQVDQVQTTETSAATTPYRRGAIGKAIIVYLFSGSAVLALLAFVLFRGMGC
jgi:hypothetical protein